DRGARGNRQRAPCRLCEYGVPKTRRSLPGSESTLDKKWQGGHKKRCNGSLIRGRAGENRQVAVYRSTVDPFFSHPACTGVGVHSDCIKSSCLVNPNSHVRLAAFLGQKSSSRVPLPPHRLAHRPESAISIF